MTPPPQYGIPAVSRMAVMRPAIAANQRSSSPSGAPVSNTIALSLSGTRRLSPRPPDPSTSTANRHGGGPWPSACMAAVASTAARRVIERISSLTIWLTMPASRSSATSDRTTAGSVDQAIARSSALGAASIESARAIAGPARSLRRSRAETTQTSVPASDRTPR